MKRIYMILLPLFLAACAPVSTPPRYETPTPNPGEIALQMLQKRVDAEATSMSVGLNFTATAQVIGQTATADQAIVNARTTDQARKDAVATANQERANIQATQARIDSDGATEQARVDTLSTQSANATATFVVMTMSAAPTSAALTQIANAQIIAQRNNEVQQSNLELEQQRQTNTIEWLIPFSIALMAAVVGAIVAIRYSRTREVRDEDGSVRVLVFDNKTVMSPRLLAGPVLDLERMTMPPMTDAAEQSKVTERSQMVEMIAALPAAPSPEASANIFGMFTSSKRFEMGTPPGEILPEETVKAIDADWKDGKDGQ